MRSIVDQVQSELSFLQAMPLYGPLIFSPLKMCVSLVQMISGLAVGVIFGIGTLVAAAVDARSLRDRMSKVADSAFDHSAKGAIHLIYATVNLASLGFIGFLVESCDYQFVDTTDKKLWHYRSGKWEEFSK